MLFETEKEANNFIRFNKEEIEAESGFSPKRSYYCLFCDGWHTTSLEGMIGQSKNERLFDQLQKEKEARKLKKGKGQGAEDAQAREEKMHEIEKQIKEMSTSHKEMFFATAIADLIQQIEPLRNSANPGEMEKIKELRLNLELYYTVRKKHGLAKASRSLDRDIEWKLWAEKKGYKTDY